MSRSFLLDTHMVSYIVSGASAAARAQLKSLDGKHPVYVSAISEAELRFGLAKVPTKTTRVSAMEIFLSKAAILSWGHREAVAYGELRRALEAAGSPLSALDMLIAAHALAMDAVLVTHDKAFRRMTSAGLTRMPQVVDWATDLAARVQ